MDIRTGLPASGYISNESATEQESSSRPSSSSAAAAVTLTSSPLLLPICSRDFRRVQEIETRFNHLSFPLSLLPSTRSEDVRVVPTSAGKDSEWEE